MSTPGNRRSTRKQDARLPHTHSGSFRRKDRTPLQKPSSNPRKVGARKSLKFDIDTGELSPVKHELVIAQPFESAPTTFDFSFIKNSRGSSSSSSIDPSSRGPSPSTNVSHLSDISPKHTAPPIPGFWNIPDQHHPPSSGTNVNRRSLRLRRTKVPITHTEPSSSNCRREPTSDFLMCNKTTQLLDQTSDYGTSSENSLYFRPSASSRSAFSTASTSSSYHHAGLSLKKKCGHRNSQNTSEQGGSQSIGYASDLDEVLSNLSIEDAQANNSRLLEPRRWDSDDDMVEDEHDRKNGCREDTGGHFRLKDFRLNDIQAVFKTHQDVCVLMPAEGYSRRNFVLPSAVSGDTNRYDLRRRPSPLLETVLSIQTFDDINLDKYFLSQGLRIFQVSPVISIQPHDVEFVPVLPATIQIPLKLLPNTIDEVHCLYNRCSIKELQSGISTVPWESVEAGRFSVSNEKVCFETTHFGLFVLVIRSNPFSSVKNVRARVGGKLLFRDMPNVEVSFPEALNEDIIKAEAKIYFDTPESLADFLVRLRQPNPSQRLDIDLHSQVETCNVTDNNLLATPIIQLEPHGMTFVTKPVLVTLPVPDYDKIMELTGSNALLKIYQSNTHSREPLQWEKLEVEYEIHHVKINGKIEVNVTFPVSHFSFFKGVWESISNCLYEAKVGMLYYFVSFAMKCQANMDEYNDGPNNTNNTSSGNGDEDGSGIGAGTGGGSRFSLEVIVFQADKAWPHTTTYKHKVGQSNPKLVKPGKITVRLKSNYFKPDLEAGEDEQMEKEEADFRGRDFEKQFILKFNKGVVIERGAFGKVLVTRTISARQRPQPIFEFNIQKYGNETDINPTDFQSEQWSIVALRELANNLFVTDGDNWRQFAQEVGMTKQEIKEANLKYNSDPFQKIVNHYRQRGGTPEELVNSLYRCNRAIKTIGNLSHQSQQSSNQTKSSNGSSGRGSLSSNNANFERFGSHDSDTSGKTSGTQTSHDSGLPRKRSHNQQSHRGSGSGSLTSSKKRRKLSDSLPGPSSSSRCRSFDADEDSDSSSDQMLTSASVKTATKSLISDSFHRTDRTVLNTQFMWKVSDHINATSWRALGRTLGLEEAVLVDIDHNHSRVNFRECAYQMLLAWQQRFPKKCTYGYLYRALVKEGMSSAAKAMTDIDLTEDS